MRYPGGMSTGCGYEMSGWNVGREYEMRGGLRMMKINGNRNGMMDGDVGMLDKTMNNKRKWVWGC